MSSWRSPLRLVRVDRTGPLVYYYVDELHARVRENAAAGLYTRTVPMQGPGSETSLYAV